MSSDPVVRDYVEIVRLRADARHVHHRHEHGHLHRQARSQPHDPRDDRVDQGAAITSYDDVEFADYPRSGLVDGCGSIRAKQVQASAIRTPDPKPLTKVELTDPLDMARGDPHRLAAPG